MCVVRVCIHCVRDVQRHLQRCVQMHVQRCLSAATCVPARERACARACLHTCLHAYTRLSVHGPARVAFLAGAAPEIQLVYIFGLYGHGLDSYGIYNYGLYSYGRSWRARRQRYSSYGDRHELPDR